MADHDLDGFGLRRSTVYTPDGVVAIAALNVPV